MEDLAHQLLRKTRTGLDGNPRTTPSRQGFAQCMSLPSILSWSLLLLHLYWFQTNTILDP